MFRVVFHPSSGAHNTLSTVSVMNETCTAVQWGTAVAQWLRCFATIRKVAGSIPAGVT